MKHTHLFVALLTGLFAVAAQADKMPIPANAPPAFKAECTSCHIAYPPALLAADDWTRVMAALDKHYGDNASLDDKTRQTIEDFLVKHARRAKKDGATPPATAASAAGNALPRLTSSNWFRRKHHEVARGDWTHAKVKSPANCAGCHTRAAEGSFREREIVMPDGRKWEG